MNTETLHRLAERADGVVGRPEDRLAEVHSRIRTVRRRRWAGAAVGMVALVVAVIGGASGLRSALEDTVREPADPPTLREGALVSLSDDGGRVVVVDGELAHVPVDIQPFTRLQFSADGRELVYVTGDRQVTALNVETGSSRVLATCRAYICQPSLSPDGRTLALEGEDGLVLYDIDRGRAEPLGVAGWSPSWSPDGKRLAYLDDRGLMLVKRDGSDPRRLATFDVQVLYPAEWSPDGSHLVFVLTEKVGPGASEDMPMVDHTLATVGLDGAPPVLLADLGHCVCLGISPPTSTWSPDGEWLAFTRLAPARDPGNTTTDGAWVMRPDGSDEQQVSAAGVEAQLAWQPTGDG